MYERPCNWTKTTEAAEGVVTAGTTPNLDKLREYMHQLRAGPIEDTSALENLLAGCWHELAVASDGGGMVGYKLLDRMEEITWNPPELKFTIARHGAVKFGFRLCRTAGMVGEH